MKLRTIGLAVLASGFMVTSAMAAMDPIPNPPEKAKPAKHHKKAAPKAAPADASAAPAAAATPAPEKKK